jgi:tagatose-6-phosphate ketose/aldose isomerase
MPYAPSAHNYSDLEEWLQTLASRQQFAELLAPTSNAREAAGYGYTLSEICQQPLLWTDTAARMVENRECLLELIAGARWLVITGSGSSQYAGECVHPVLQAELGFPTFTAGGGWLLLEGARGLPPAEPGLLVSLARSGGSPESVAVVEQYLEMAPRVRHLVITCNADGPLATRFRGNRRVSVVVLDSRTNDRSLVMTSSFTNMTLAARALGLLGRREAIERLSDDLADAGKYLLSHHSATIKNVAEGPFRRAVFLASGCRFGAARESALKMLEMNAGCIPTMAETYLELRHGPMCLVNRETLVVCFLACDPLTRAYEEDLIAELHRKQIGARLLLVGEHVPPGLLGADDIALEIPGLAALGDDNVAVLDAMVGQLLGFFRCLAGGLRPDMPSSGVISRVVSKFAIHRRQSESV